MNDVSDTHAHIYLEEFDEDREEMLTRARDAGVKRVFMPNIDRTSIDRMLDVQEKNSGYCFSMMGLHPCSVKEDFEKQLEIVEGWLNKRTFHALGEMGTDLYWDKSFWDQQKEAFNIQASWAVKYNLPLVIHCRESINETISLLMGQANPKLKGVFHCFSGTAEQAKEIAELGFYFGIGGVVTFKNGGLDKVVPALPMDRIIFETDSPYLAPAPNRGKRNEPAFITLPLKRTAQLLGIEESDIAKRAEENAARLFGNLKASS